MFEIPLPAQAGNEQYGLGRTYLLQAKALQAVESSTLAALALAARFIGTTPSRELRAGSARRLFLMVSGHAAVRVREKVIELPGAGELFGEEHILGSASATTVTLLGRASALAIPASALGPALADSPALARALLENLSRRSLRLAERMQWHASRRAAERMAGFIMEKLPAGEGPCDVKLPASKTILASLLSMSKESFSRCLGQLAAETGISSAGCSVHVPAPWRLAKVCGRGRDCADCGRCRHAERWIAGSQAA